MNLNKAISHAYSGMIQFINCILRLGHLSPLLLENINKLINMFPLLHNELLKLISVCKAGKNPFNVHPTVCA